MMLSAALLVLVPAHRHRAHFAHRHCVAVDFVRTRGLYRGAGNDLRRRLRALPVGETDEQLGKDLTTFVTERASRLRRGENC